jgi:hypothetical protein
LHCQNLFYCSEHANLSITLVGVESGEVLGHMALFDYPNVKSVNQSDWEHWIHTNFQCRKASVRAVTAYLDRVQEADLGVA